MERYSDQDGFSGIEGFEIGSDSITIQFKDRWNYLYNYESAGQQIVEQMKILAGVGRGLNSFINANTRKRYAKKWKSVTHSSGYTSRT